jgi:hypothetical protein
MAYHVTVNRFFTLRFIPNIIAPLNAHQKSFNEITINKFVADHSITIYYCLAILMPVDTRFAVGTKAI